MWQRVSSPGRLKGHVSFWSSSTSTDEPWQAELNSGHSRLPTEGLLDLHPSTWTQSFEVTLLLCYQMLREQGQPYLQEPFENFSESTSSLNTLICLTSTSVTHMIHSIYGVGGVHVCAHKHRFHTQQISTGVLTGDSVKSERQVLVWERENCIDANCGYVHNCVDGKNLMDVSVNAQVNKMQLEISYVIMRTVEKNLIHYETVVTQIGICQFDSLDY